MDKFIISPKQKTVIKLAPISLKGFCIGERLMNRVFEKFNVRKNSPSIPGMILDKESVAKIVAAFLEEYEDKTSKKKRLCKK